MADSSFPPAFAIYCSGHLDRREYSDTHFRAAGINPIWWRSPHGSSWGLATTKPNPHQSQPLAPRGVALILGHYCLWQHLLYNGIEQAIILEDDAVLPEDFVRQVTEILAIAPAGWEFLFLGTVGTVGVHKAVQIIPPRFARYEYPFGTHCYAVRLCALETLLDNMAVAEANIDLQLYDRVLQHDLIEWYVCCPSIADQRSANGEWSQGPIGKKPRPAPGGRIAALESSQPESSRAIEFHKPYTALETIGTGPRTIHSVDSSRLVPGADGRKFNPSLFLWEGSYRLAYRNGCFPFPRICLSELDSRWNPCAGRELELIHPLCAAGAEDPRFFIFHGRPYLAFTGVSFPEPGIVSTSVLFAELSDRLEVKEVWEPVYRKRRTLEKNWSPFEVDGKLYCVYSIHPHLILEIDPATRQATDAHETHWSPPWATGILRGGAPPVRVGHEFWSVFHNVYERREPTWFTYSAGIYTFSARPPFAPLRMVPGPIWQADPHKVGLNFMRDKQVLYPCGALREGDLWLISAGHHDYESLIGTFSHSELESLFEAAKTNPARSVRGS